MPPSLTDQYRIVFNRPTFQGNELRYIREAIENGVISGDGPFSKKAQALLEKTLDVPKVLLTGSCTHALELSVLLLNIRAGDEVILPSFTFVSTVNAFVLFGAKPVFIDIRPDTLNLDETQLEGAITAKTKAIVPVHYGGVGCEMDAIGEIAQRRGIAVVEDNAHGLFGKYKNRWLGSFGQLAALSFHETKNFTCGEGGALLVNEKRFVERAEILREKGTDRMRFFRGEVEKYSWVDIGSSYLPSDLQAAFLFAQLEVKDRIQEKRRRIWDRYREQLGAWAEGNGVQLPFIPTHCQQSYHMFYLILPNNEKRSRLIQHLQKKGILSVFHYIPLHVSPMGKRFGYREGELPFTESISKRLVRLPFYTDLEEDLQRDVVRAIWEAPIT
ncbi:MAG: dTDP-4-amino-4,6-dideoxygalactose transaminase [Candidatus Omnitrophota bacterium]|jgi:dTDP-4-amino-4,6-dideoxygalactose transaminase|nr:MAG: dTDP-4-amino-4,6-dideoxygalactose transaminase [Candidatus Omnitrophota bacterium]